MSVRDGATLPEARRRRRWVPLVVLALAACGSGAERPIQGYIEGEYLRVAAPFAGKLQQLSVRRGSEVSGGALLYVVWSGG